MRELSLTRTLWRSASLWLVCMIAAACAPHLEHAGPRTTVPVLGAQHIVTGDGAALPIRIWRATGKPSAIMLALHGFNDYSQSFEEPARFWAQSGITTYAYDQRGFGAAPQPGRFATTDTLVADLASVSHLLRARHPGLPLYLLGESMGAAVIMAGITSNERPVSDGIILAAPAVWGRATMNPLMRVALWFGAHTVPWMRVTGRGLKIRPSDNVEMLRALARDPFVIKETRIDSLYGLVNLMDEALAAAPQLEGRMLLLYGANEQLIPDRSIYSLVKRLQANPERRIANYKMGYHMLLRDLGANAVLRDIAAWISSPDAPLPSGADLVQR